ncbi:MAG: hypothetical protein ACREUW_06950 [Burkholderiales bacterium]
MVTPQNTPRDKTLNGLLLGTLILAGIALVREGPHYDNVIDGWRFFTLAFFSGSLAGFIGWTQTFKLTPAFRIAGAYRQPWLAALIAGVLTCTAASWLNRSFSTPTDTVLTGMVDLVEEGRGDRWHVGVKLPDGRFERYLIDKDAAEALKGAKAVRIGVARGLFGFEILKDFAPAPPPG